MIGEWINIDLEKDILILGIILQGRADWNQNVITYKVEYSSDNINFIDTGKIYSGVTDPNYRSVRFYDYIPFIIKVRYIRVFPQSWKD